MTIQVPANQSETKSVLKTNLERMLKAVGAAPVTIRQKLRLYKAGICLWLTWLLTVQELPITWVERQLEATATRFVKKWAGLARSASTALLYLPQRMSALNLLSPSALYKQLQVSTPGFEFYVVTRSYSSRPFLCALGCNFAAWVG